MIGTIGRLKQSKISKICAFILSLVVGLSSFLLLSPTCFADQITPFDSIVSVTHTNGQIKFTNYIIFSNLSEWKSNNTISTTNSYGSTEYNYSGFYVLHIDAGYYVQFNNYISQVDSFTGRLRHEIKVDLHYKGTPWTSNPSNRFHMLKPYIDNANVSIDNVYTLAYEYSSYSTSGNDDDFHLYFNPWISVDDFSFNSYIPITYSFDVIIPFYAEPTNNMSTLTPIGEGTFTYDSNFTDSIYASGYLYASDVIFEKSIYSSINSGTSSIVSALNNMNTVVNTDLSSVNNSISSAASQAHSDASILHNSIINDSSGSSQNSASVQSSFEAANQAADQAIDSAVHNYDAQLDEVENVNFDTFFTSQRSAVTFWRDVGEFVLNSSNLGYIASGMIIVTLIGLFVFLLRL